MMERCLPVCDPGANSQRENKKETGTSASLLRKHPSATNFDKYNPNDQIPCHHSSTSLPNMHPYDLNASTTGIDITMMLNLNRSTPSTPPRDARQPVMTQGCMSPCYSAVAQFQFQRIATMSSLVNDETNCDYERTLSPIDSPEIWFCAKCHQETPPPYDETQGGVSTNSPAAHRRVLFSEDSAASSQESENQLIFQQFSFEDDQFETKPPPYTPIDMLASTHNNDAAVRNALQLVARHPEIDEEIRSTIMHSIQLNSFDIIRNCVTDGNLIHYLIAAEKLNLSELKELCEGRYINQLQKGNCLDTFQIACSYNCYKLIIESLHTISRNFGCIWQTDAFQYLGGRTLMLLVSNESIRTHPDMKNALERWLLYEKDDCRERIYHEISQLLPKSTETDTEKVLTSSGTLADVSNCSNSYIALLTCDDQNRHIKVLLIDIKRSKLSVPKIMPTFNIGPEYAACSGTISEAPYLFLSGGAERSAKCLLKLDVVENKWKNCKKMNKARSRHTMEMISERIYVIGGFHDGSNLPSIEEYDPRKNTWRTMFDLIYPVRSTMSAVYKGNVYLFGGKLSNNKPISSIQCFNPSQMSITCIGELPVACSCGSAIVSGKKIFVATGSGDLFLYDPEIKSTVVCSRQLSKRKHFGMFWGDGKVYLVGGVRGEEPDSGISPLADSIDAYEPAIDQWSSVRYLPEPVPIFSTCRIIGYRPFQQGFGYHKTQEIDLEEACDDNIVFK